MVLTLFSLELNNSLTVLWLLYISFFSIISMSSNFKLYTACSRWTNMCWSLEYSSRLIYGIPENTGKYYSGTFSLYQEVPRDLSMMRSWLEFGWQVKIIIGFSHKASHHFFHRFVEHTTSVRKYTLLSTLDRKS